MHIPHFIIIGVAAGAMFAVGCSKSSTSSPDPIVSFQGYKVGSDGMNRATFQFRNPSQSRIVCRVQIQPGDSSSGEILSIPAGGRSTDTMLVKQTNAVSLSVTVMRLVPGHQISVPMQ
jgi:hypothetical protein